MQKYVRFIRFSFLILLLEKMVTNMSIKNCKIPIELDFWDRLPLSSQIEPKKEDGFNILNPSARLSKYATDFYPINSGNQWGSKDPRLFASDLP